MEWKLFGWQGFGCRTPADWEIAAQQGDFRKGYVRLNDSTMPRMEIKWERKRRTPELADMERAYERGRKRDRGLEPLPGHPDTNIPAAGFRFLRFRWKGRTIFEDALVSFPETRRGVVIRIYAESRQKGEDFTRRVLGSLEDQLAGERTLWTAYGFACGVPSGFGLRKADLRAGFLHLGFERGREQLEFQRLRLGSFPPDQRDPEAWLRRIGGRADPGRVTGHVAGHECRRVAIRKNPLVARLRRPWLRPMRRAWLWRCPETESLFLVKASADESEPRGRWQVWCHEAPSPAVTREGPSRVVPPQKR